MKRATELIHFKTTLEDPYNASVAPLYQTATFAQESAFEAGPYDYTRSGNPTRTAVEEQLAALEGAHRAFAFNSGMAAIYAVTQLLQAGDEILAGSDLYGGTYRLLGQLLPKQGITVRYVDTTDLQQVKKAFTEQTRLLMFETPSNPLQKITDLKAITALAHEHDVLVAVDGTLLSPYLQNPMEFGVDIVIHSATKYLCGHSDVSAGIVAVNSQELAERIYFFQNATGNALAPFDAWLLSRGLKTLSLRIDKQQKNAQKIAEYLEAHPYVKKVHYPGLSTHPGYTLQKRQAKGAGALIAFEVGSLEEAGIIADAAKLFKISVSFGSITSLISLPCRMSHASIPPELREQAALPRDLIRLSIGIEEADDLIADLDAAIQTAFPEPLRKAS